MTTKPSLFKNQDYNKIKKQCLKNGELFFDEFFELDVPGVMWLRPKKIVKDPRFFVGTASRFDVVQGHNQGCWLLVAMANLTMNPTLFHHVVPKNQKFTEDYAGIFYFHIWQCGKWMEVVIDDRLPTRASNSEGRKLKFCHSRNRNEFWSALLEKAYAKLYGSYNEITSGWFNEAMVDFTGGICETVDLQPPPRDVDSIITKSLQQSSFMCVFMIDDPSVKEMVLHNGLVKGHAYSVTKTATVTSRGRKVKLIRLRNPWGQQEWTGPWSDSSSEWETISNTERKELGLVAENDGEFWMTFADFAENFEHIDICHLSPEFAFESADGKEKHAWKTNLLKGEWAKGVNAGGRFWETFPINPQYRIVLNETDGSGKCPVLVGLMQKNKTRQIWNKIGFTTYFLKGPERMSNKPLSKEYIQNYFKDSYSCKFMRRRENVVRDAWKPGVYTILPSTQYPDKEAQYLLRFYSEKTATMEENDTIEPVQSRRSNQEDEEPEDIVPTKSEGEDEPEPVETIDWPKPKPKLQPKETTPAKSKPKVWVPKTHTLLKRNEKEISSFFDRVSGDEKEIGWQGLQSIFEYALTNSQSYSSAGFCDRIVSFFSSIFSNGSTDDKLFSKAECRKLIVMLDDDRSGRLSLREFQVLWRKLLLWESVFLEYSNNSSLMESTHLGKALKEIGYDVKPSEVSSLSRKFCNDKGKLAFDDFVACSVDLMTS